MKIQYKKFRHILGLFVVFCVLGVIRPAAGNTIYAFVMENDDGKIKAEFETSTNTLTLKSSNGQDIDMPEYSEPYQMPWDSYRHAWKLVIDNHVKTISKEAFKGMSVLETVTFRGSIKSIGERAFYRVAPLQKISLNVNSPLVKMTIGKGAFEECDWLKEVTLPPVVDIGDNAFKNCLSLESVRKSTYAASSVTIGKESFRECIKLFGIGWSEDVSQIGEGAFRSSGIEKFKFGPAIKKIEKEAFAGARLMELSIPKNVESIGDCAFVENFCSEPVFYCKNVNLGADILTIKSIIEVKCYSGSTVDKYFTEKGVNVTYLDKTTPTIKPDENEKDKKSGIWTYDSIKGLAYIHGCSGTGDIKVPALLNGKKVAFIAKETFPKKTDITSITIESNTASSGYLVLDDYLLEGCTELKSVTLSNIVSGIGNHGFDGCTALQSITIPESVSRVGTYAFKDCTALRSVKWSKNVKGIFNYTFAGCSALRYIYDVSEVEFIAEGAFLDSGLTEYKFSNALKYIGEKAFCNTKLKEAKLAVGVETISDYAFSQCTELVTLVIPSSVKTLGMHIYNKENVRYRKERAAIYYYCSLAYIGDSTFDAPQTIYTTSSNASGVNLSFLGSTRHILITYYSDSSSKCVINQVYNLPENLYLHDIYMISRGVPLLASSVELKEKMFENNLTIKAVTFPSTMQKISKAAFCGCYNLKSAIIGKQVKYIEDNAFNTCFSLSTILEEGIFENLESIGDYAFQYTPISNMDIFRNVKKFGNYAFAYTRVTNYTMSSNLVDMGQYVFARTPMKTVTWSDKLHVIPLGTFSESSIESISIPNNLTKIEDIAFYRCVHLKQIYIPDSVTSLGMSAFEGTSDITMLTTNAYAIDFAIHHSMKYESPRK